MIMLLKNVRLHRVMIAVSIILSIVLLQRFNQYKGAIPFQNDTAISHHQNHVDSESTKFASTGIVNQKISDTKSIETPKNKFIFVQQENQSLSSQDLSVERAASAQTVAGVPESVTNFRNIISAKCLDCFIVESTVNEMITDTCHVPISLDLLRDTMSSNPMYVFLLALKTQNETIFKEYVTTAWNTVDCEDSYQWLNKSKQLFSDLHPTK